MNIANAVAALGPGALTEDALRRHIYPLFSRTLAAPGIYLANHSLGRPLDQTEDDLREGFHLWQTKLGNAWDEWQEEQQQHRARIAQLIGAPRPDCVIPKSSAGQGLRTVLNALPGMPRVLSTSAEFDSVDVILKQYAAVGRIHLETVSCHRPDGAIDLAALYQAVEKQSVDLVIVSQVLFSTGQVLPHLDRLADACHRSGARLLVDAYHAIGVLPVNLTAMQADFAIGGSYKYLRGGPGAAFLYISPGALESGLAAHRYRMVRQRGTLPLRPPRSAALRTRRRCFPRIHAACPHVLSRHAPASSLRSRSASTASAPSRLTASPASSAISPMQASPPTAQTMNTAPSSPSNTPKLHRSPNNSRTAASSPTHAANTFVSVPTTSPPTPKCAERPPPSPPSLLLATPHIRVPCRDPEPFRLHRNSD